MIHGGETNMDCREVKEKLASQSERKLESAEKEAVERHLQECTDCRRRYGHRLDFQAPQRLSVAGRLKAKSPPAKGRALQPVEFKDLPVRFDLQLDGKTEAIKMVEPEVDLPLPENAELRIMEGDICLRMIAFRFDREHRCYLLTFHNRDRSQDSRRTFTEMFGPDPKPQQKVRDPVFTREIFRRHNLLAWIEMARAKARIRIRCEPATD
jgi:hypothetical protein